MSKKLDIKDMVNALQKTPEMQTQPTPESQKTEVKESQTSAEKKGRGGKRKKEESRVFPLLLKDTDFNKIDSLMKVVSRKSSLGRVSVGAIIKAALRSCDGGDAFKSTLEELINDDGRRRLDKGGTPS